MLIFGFLQEHVGNLVCNHMNDKMEAGEESAKQKKDRRRDLREYCSVLEWCVCEGLRIIQCQVGQGLRKSWSR